MRLDKLGLHPALWHGCIVTGTRLVTVEMHEGWGGFVAVAGCRVLQYRDGILGLHALNTGVQPFATSGSCRCLSPKVISYHRSHVFR